MMHLSLAGVIFGDFSGFLEIPFDVDLTPED